MIPMRMSSRPSLAVGLLGVLICVFGSTLNAANADSKLAQRISQHIAQEKFAAAVWGVKVVSLKDGRTIFERHADKLLIPASNAKLFTAALALDRLGTDFRFRTSLYSSSSITGSGTLRGDLIVYGRGDPTFAAHFNEGDYRKSLYPVYRALKAAGVKRITGAIIGDESFFRGPSMGYGWTWDDLQEYYGAETSALTVDDNTIDVAITPGKRLGEPCRIVVKPTTGLLTFINGSKTGAPNSPRRIKLHRPVGQNTVHVNGSLPLGSEARLAAVAIHKPAGLFLELLAQTLETRKINVSSKRRTVDWRRRLIEPLDTTRMKEIAFVESRPFPEILNAMMKRSQNLYAQLFLLQVGEMAVRTGAAGADENDAAFVPTSEAAGLAELAVFLDEAGIPADDVLLQEGSGLTRASLIKPSATVALLKHMRGHPAAAQFLAALPIAGVDGTLRNRMKGTAAEGNLRAKTGTLRYVHTLSGYVDADDGEPLAFSIMLNNFLHPDANASARAELDKIAVMLAESGGEPRMNKKKHE
jgi:D-alanyl-D-alanine carboxypeptidase/D-alanyl-D-alanine-endopeptidase (penicillin-binding protein 4)